MARWRGSTRRARMSRSICMSRNVEERNSRSNRLRDASETMCFDSRLGPPANHSDARIHDCCSLGCSEDSYLTPTDSNERYALYHLPRSQLLSRAKAESRCPHEVMTTSPRPLTLTQVELLWSHSAGRNSAGRRSAGILWGKRPRLLWFPISSGWAIALVGTPPGVFTQWRSHGRRSPPVLRR